MAIAQKQIEYAVEVEKLFDVLVGLIKDVKAGKKASEIMVSELPAFVAALSGLGELNGELKNVKVVEETVGRRLGDLVAVLTLGV